MSISSRSRLFALAVLLLVLSSQPSAFGDEQNARDDLKQEVNKLQGTWEPLLLEHGGKILFKGPDEALKGASLILTGQTYNMKIRGVFQGIGEFKLDLKSTPKRMDVVLDPGIKQQQTILWIYKLEGDTLTLCGTSIGGAHPKDFVTTPDSPNVLLKLKRVKAQKP